MSARCNHERSGSRFREGGKVYAWRCRLPINHRHPSAPKHRYSMVRVTRQHKETTT